MAKINNILGLFKSNIVYSFKKEIKEVKNKQVLSKQEEIDTYFKQISKMDKVFVCYLDKLTCQIIYEGYLVNDLIRRDYSKDLYTKVASSLKLDTELISGEILNHIANEYIKAFNKLTLGFYDDNKFSRYIISRSTGDTTFISNKYVKDYISYLPIVFSSKRVLTFSKYADLVKVQFIKLKTGNRYRNRFDYNLFSIDLNETISNTDRTTYFETLDALKMKVLNYTFEIGLIENSPFSLLFGEFIYGMKSTSIVLDDSLFGLFDIVKTKDEVPENNRDFISLQDYNTHNTIDDFTATSYLSKTSVIEQTKENNK
jgi:hypothetical protein